MHPPVREEDAGGSVGAAAHRKVGMRSLVITRLPLGCSLLIYSISGSGM